MMFNSRRSIAALIDAQATVAPERIAVETSSDRLNYRAFVARAEQVARVLRRHNARPGSRIAVAMSRGVELVTALLAIVKTGAAYIPLAPTLPRASLQAFVDEIRPDIVLTDTRSDGLIAHPCAREWSTLAAAASMESADPQPDDCSPERLFAILYTSGTTRHPRGVMIPERAVRNQLGGMIVKYDFDSDCRVLVHRSPALVGALFDYFGALTVGATCVLATDREASSPASLLALLRTRDISYFAAAPSLLRTMTRYAVGEPRPCDSVRLTITGGEFLAPSVAAAFRRVFPAATLVNTYGATEALYIAQAECDDSADPRRVGSAAANVRIDVVDADLQTLPPDVVGEVCVGGDSLSLGYFGDPRRTAAQFVPDAQSPSPGARVYRTGDLGFLSPDGTLTLLGRRDHQVKIRGFRVELDEIERALHRLPDVTAAAVVTRVNAAEDERLVAFVVAAHPEVTERDIRGKLQEQLPAPMIPTRIVCVATLPSLASGKIDRRAVGAGLDSGGPVKSPSLATERHLA